MWSREFSFSSYELFALSLWMTSPPMLLAGLRVVIHTDTVSFEPTEHQGARQTRAASDAPLEAWMATNEQLSTR